MQPQFARGTSTTILAGHLKEQHKSSPKGKRQFDPKHMIFHQESGNIFLPDVMPYDVKAVVFDALVDWIVDNKQAFRIVENSKFQKFVSRLNNLHRLTSRRIVV